jgi:hypothetical protein
MRKMSALTVLTACLLAGQVSLPLAATAPSGPQVAWLAAASDADIERAFAQGRATS